MQIFKENQLTIGLDVGDRYNHYCILNGSGRAEEGQLMVLEEVTTKSW
jgi:hypothetical protein